jgi:hypothetical protein
MLRFCVFAISKVKKYDITVMLLLIPPLYNAIISNILHVYHYDYMHYLRLILFIISKLQLFHFSLAQD